MHDHFDHQLSLLGPVSALQTIEDRGRTELAVHHLTMRFEDMRSQMLRPRMEQVSRFLAARRVESAISTNDRRYDRGGRLIGAVGITLRVFQHASAEDKIGSIPHYAIYWEPVNLVVRFYKNTNAARLAGELVIDGKASLNELTSDLVEQKLLRFAEALV